MQGKRLFILLVTALLAGQAFAQENTAGAATSKASAEESVFGLKMQHRYSPSDLPFRDTIPGRNGFLRALENTSISIMGSYNRWLDKDLSSGPMAGVALSKWLSPLHGFRVEAGAGFFLNNETGGRVKILPDVRVSHLFNLSAYLYGYNASAPGYFYTLGGMGYAWQVSGGKGEGLTFSGDWIAQLGFGYSVRVARGWDLFVEPVFELNGNRFVHQEDGNWRGYFGGVRGNVGLSYRIDRWNSLLPPRREHPWFIETAGGPAWQLNAPIGRTGYHVMLGVGERISPAFSLRLSGTWTQVFNSADKEDQFTYGAARLEAMTDLLALAGGDNLPWGVSLLAGPEAGLVHTTGSNPAIVGGIGILKGQTAYIGATAGAQLRARLYQRISAILEPRASFVPYVIRADDSSAENHLDVILSTNLGLQYAIPSVQERKAAWQRTQEWDRQAWDDLLATRDRAVDRWHRHIEPKISLFASIEGSYFRPLGRDFANGPIASLSIGGWFNPVNGLMVNAGLGYFQDLQYGNGYVKSSEFSAAYLFNITRFVHGTDPSQMVNLSLMAGAGYMLPIREVWQGSAIFRTGLDLRMHVLSRTDLVLRPEMDLLKDPSETWSPALRGTFGLSYSVGGTPEAKFTDSGREWFAGLGAGYQNEIVRLAGESYEDDPLGEYRINVFVGRKYSAKMDWRLSVSYLSQIHDDRQNSTFAHRLRFASMNIDALYNLVGDDKVDRRWSLSLVGGPEIGLQHKGNEGENSKGSGLILQRSTISAYLGLSAGVQVKYRFTDGLSAFLEPKYSLAPYVARTTAGEENYYSHIYGTNFGLEYAFGHDRYRSGTVQPDTEKGPHTTFIQLTASAFRPFGRGYANGPIVSIGVGHWFRGASGVLLDAGVGYFRDNLLSKAENGRVVGPQHMAAAEIRASYLLSLNRLASLNEGDRLLDISLIGGVGYLIPEIKQKAGTITGHAGFDFRMHVFPGTDLLFQPELEIFRDPHSLVDGSMKGIGGAFRGTFGLAFNMSGGKIVPVADPGKDWFVGLVGGIQNESTRLADAAGSDIYRSEYRAGLFFGRSFAGGIGIRATGTFSEAVPQESTFLHSLRLVTANLDILYDLLHNERGDNRVSLSLIAGPEAGLFNKNYSGDKNEKPMVFPIRIGRRTNHGVGAYIGLSAGVQFKVRVYDGLSLFLEQRYSMVPYVMAVSNLDHRNMTTHLWNANLGIQYSFGRKN